MIWFFPYKSHTNHITLHLFLLPSSLLLLLLLCSQFKSRNSRCNDLSLTTTTTTTTSPKSILALHQSQMQGNESIRSIANNNNNNNQDDIIHRASTWPKSKSGSSKWPRWLGRLLQWTCSLLVYVASKNRFNKQVDHLSIHETTTNSVA